MKCSSNINFILIVYIHNCWLIFIYIYFIYVNIRGEVADRLLKGSPDYVIGSTLYRLIFI